MERKRVKVIWVSSWRDIPCRNKNSTLKAWSDPKTGDIWAIRGVTTKAEVEHEKYHSIKRHPDNPRNPRDYVEQELKAYLYAHEQIGKPRSILMRLRAIFNDLTIYDYKVKPDDAIKIVREELFSLDVPNEWKENYYKLFGEYRLVYGKLQKH